MYETLENIEKFDLRLIQDERYFKFGVDAVGLAEFASAHALKTENYLDMFSGTGIVGLVFARLRQAEPIFIEIDDYYAKINEKNLDINKVDGRVLNIDFRRSLDYLEAESMDIITANPPYMKKNHGLKTGSRKKDLAKIEDEEDFLADFFEMSFKLLKDKGRLYLVHRAERLVDIMNYSRDHKMEAKRLCHMRKENSKKPAVVLMEFVKNGASFLNIEDDYIIGG